MYHITNENRVRPCTAGKKKCPYKDHFQDRAEAEMEADDRIEEERYNQKQEILKEFSDGMLLLDSQKKESIQKLSILGFNEKVLHSISMRKYFVQVFTRDWFNRHIELMDSYDIKEMIESDKNASLEHYFPTLNQAIIEKTNELLDGVSKKNPNYEEIKKEYTEQAYSNLSNQFRELVSNKEIRKFLIDDAFISDNGDFYIVEFD